MRICILNQGPLSMTSFMTSKLMEADGYPLLRLRKYNGHNTDELGWRERMSKAIVLCST